MPQPRNAIEAVTHDAPYPYYAKLRETPLVFDTGLDLWVASNAAVVDEALAQPALLVRPPDEAVPRTLVGTTAGAVFAQLVRMTDGRFHAQHKPQVVANARRWNSGAIAQATLAASADLMGLADRNRFTTALPVRTMARLLGVADALLDETVRQVHDFTAGIAPGASAEAIGAAGAAAEVLMAQGRAEGLDDAQAANRIAFMQQALDATAALLGNSACLAAGQPQWEAFAAQSIVDARALVAEVARWDSPVHNTRRFAADDLVLAGQRLARGSAVLLVLASANRDAAANPEPDRFDPARSKPRLFTFGAAAHACPGTTLAIEIVANYLYQASCAGTFASYFGPRTGWRPLGNIRAPVFG